MYRFNKLSYSLGAAKYHVSGLQKLINLNAWKIWLPYFYPKRGRVYQRHCKWRMQLKLENLVFSNQNLNFFFNSIFISCRGLFSLNRDDPQAESDVHFEPIVKLPDHVQLITGEEDEQVLLVLFQDKFTILWKNIPFVDILGLLCGLFKSTVALETSLISLIPFIYIYKSMFIHEKENSWTHLNQITVAYNDLGYPSAGRGNVNLEIICHRTLASFGMLYGLIASRII